MQHKESNLDVSICDIFEKNSGWVLKETCNCNNGTNLGSDSIVIEISETKL